ncbi:hypothetical protein [Caudoviricetes sp.]|nr:hypothetical protein [Caudoviricetes sp.]
MARTKGALNKRTRLALREAESGKLDGGETLAYLIRVANDRHKDEQIRMQAANIVLPYLRPKLSAVEQTNVDATRSESEIMQQIKQLVEAKPELLNDLLPAGKVLVSVGSTVVQPQQTLPDAPKPQNSGDNDAHYEADKA